MPWNVRLGEAAIAATLVGALAFVCWTAIGLVQFGELWLNPNALFVVPMSLLFGLAAVTVVFHSITAVWLPVLTVAIVLLVFFSDRFLVRRWPRMSFDTVVLGAFSAVTSYMISYLG